MKWKDLNPIAWTANGLNAALNKVAPKPTVQIDPATLPAQSAQAPQGSNLPVPATPATPVLPDDQGKDATIVQGEFIEQSAQMQAIVTAAARKTEQFRQEAESFDDEKAPLPEKGLRVVFSAFAYLFPLYLAYYIGQATGDAFTPSGASASYAQYAHILSVGLETAIPMLGLCVSLTFRRAAKDRSQVALCAVFVLLFLALGVGNAVVQIFMVTKNLGDLTPKDQTAVYFRAFAPMAIDLICTLYLSVTGAKSLKRYLADKRAVMEAVRDVSGVNILLDQQQHTAALNEMTAMLDMQSKQKRAQTWNRIEAAQAEKMVRSAEKAMRDDDDDDTSGSYRRRRY